MTRLALFASSLALGFISLPGPVYGQECRASIVTGIDVSASISHDELLMQLDGITAALQSPAVISAIQSQGCARMAVFVWSDQPPVVLLPWTDVGTVEQAEQVSAVMTAAAHDFQAPKGTLTAVGEALAFAWQMLGQIPPTGKQVVNIISNGESNQGRPPLPVSQQMRAAGITINAVLFGPSATIDQYYRENVTGGIGSFVMRIDAADDMAAAFRSKFIMDISMVQP